jgi:hypothetical protein
MRTKQMSFIAVVDFIALSTALLFQLPEQVQTQTVAEESKPTKPH